jgi:hypothetical protein
VSAFARFVALPGSRRLLLVRAALAVSGFRLALTLLPFRYVRSLAGRRHAPRSSPRATPDELAWGVTAVGRRLRSTCLTDALALQALLLREGHDASLRLGVARTHGGRLEAHAWLESGGRVLIGGPESARFTELPLASG